MRSTRSKKKVLSVEELGYGNEEVQVPEDACCIDYMLPKKYICLGCQRFLESMMGAGNADGPLVALLSRDAAAWSLYREKRALRHDGCEKYCCEHPFDASKFLPDPKDKNKKGQSSSFRPTKAQKTRCDDICKLIADKRTVIKEEASETAQEQQANFITPANNKKRTKEQASAGTSKKQARMCGGWVGDAYRPLVTASWREHLKAHEDKNSMKQPGSFPLDPEYEDFKDFEKLIVRAEVVGLVESPTESAGLPRSAIINYVIRSTGCTGQAAEKSRLCCQCSAVSSSLSMIQRNVGQLRESGVQSHATKKKFAVMSPDASAQFVRDVRTYKNNQLDNLTRKVKRLEALLEKRKTSFNEPNPDNQVTLRTIVEKALPIVKGRWGESSLQAAVFMSSLRMMSSLAEGQNPKGFRYPEEVIIFSLFLLHRCDKATYEQLASILHLPTRRHVRNIKAKRFGNAGEGPYDKAIEAAADKIEKSDLSDAEKAIAYKVFVTWDSARMRGSIMISTRKEDNGRLVGVVHVQNESIAEQEFDNFLNSVKRNMDDDDGGAAVTADINVRADDMAEALKENTEHTVFYALSKGRKLKLEFIAGTYNNV